MRRRIVLAALLVLPALASACSALATGPRGEECTTVDGRSGYVTPTGECAPN